MKLWDKGYSMDGIVERFTVGQDRDIDLHLAKYDVLVNKAHAEMLLEIGILNRDELDRILEVLDELKTEIDEGTFVIPEGMEDVHSKVEFELVQRIGGIGRKIHTGRSRNDQVLTDLHLYCKEQCGNILVHIEELFCHFIEMARRYSDVPMPGYTHMQAAMPSSFGVWFGAYAEALVDDVIMLNGIYKIADQNPLGSAAGYGTSIPINRGLTTRLLGFGTLKYNVLCAQMSRGKLESLMAYGLASVASTLSKFSSDVCLFMSQNFGFIGLPKEFTSGSSIMPHKQNPDVFEVIRGKCSRAQNLSSEVTLLRNNLPSGYHRDFQLLKKSLVDGVEDIKEVLKVSAYVVPQLKVNREIMANPLYNNIYSVEEVNRMVMAGVPFREAYKEVSKATGYGNFKDKGATQYVHEGSTGNLCLKEIIAKFYDAYSENIRGRA